MESIGGFNESKVQKAKWRDEGQYVLFAQKVA